LPVEGNQTPLYFILNYDGLITENFRLQDSTKIVPAYLNKEKIFKYKIPFINGNSFILNAWTTPSDFSQYDDLLLQCHAPDNTTTWYFRIDLILVCRGPTSAIENKILSINSKPDEVKEQNEGNGEKSEKCSLEKDGKEESPFEIVDK
jgi:hypothetical protein